MGAFHLQHVRGAPAHRRGHAAGYRGCRGRRAVPLADDLSSRACTAAIRAVHDPAQAPGFRACRPGPAGDHAGLSAVGAFLAAPAAGHRFRGALTKRAAAQSAEVKPGFVAKPGSVAEPERVLSVTVTVPEPEFTGSDRLRRLTAITSTRPSGSSIAARHAMCRPVSSVSAGNLPAPDAKALR
jgi:hypothetical protein